MGHTRVRSLTNLQEVANYVEQHAHISHPALDQTGPLTSTHTTHDIYGNTTSNGNVASNGNISQGMLSRSHTITERPMSLYSGPMNGVPTRVSF